MNTDKQTQESSENTSTLEFTVIEVLKTCYDPEIPINIYEMGLIYSIEVLPGNNINISMTLTSPACPVAESLPGEVQTKIKAIPSVHDVNMNLVWDPPWHPDMMSEAAKLQLGF
ncbi:MAG: DUF59 domain-containing protein [Chlamydiota bacterium]|nr:DUF59 domain-containing protein [Chlamydiota bacterium]